jgi:hypothetical protein
VCLGKQVGSRWGQCSIPNSEIIEEFVTSSKRRMVQGQAWRYTPVIPALRREDYDFKASLGYIVRSCLKKQTEREREREIPHSLTDSHSCAQRLPGPVEGA